MFSIKSLAIVAVVVALWGGAISFLEPHLFKFVDLLTTLSYLLAFLPFLMRSQSPKRAFFYGYGITGVYLVFRKNPSAQPIQNITQYIFDWFCLLTPTDIEKYREAGMNFSAADSTSYEDLLNFVRVVTYFDRIQYLVVFLLSVGVGLIALWLFREKGQQPKSEQQESQPAKRI